MLAFFSTLPAVVSMLGLFDAINEVVNHLPKSTLTFVNTISYSYVSFVVHDILDTNYGRLYRRRYKSDALSEDKFLYYSRSIQRIARLPWLAYGLYCLYVLTERVLHKGLHFNAVDYLILINGLLVVSLASSMYLKDSDPKLLDKQPMWKKASDF